MVGLLFEVAKHSLDKIKLHFTVSCFLYQESLPYQILNSKCLQICVILSAKFLNPYQRGKEM